MSIKVRFVRFFLRPFIVIFLTLLFGVSFCVVFLSAVKIYGGVESFEEKYYMLIDIIKFYSHKFLADQIIVSSILAFFGAIKCLVDSNEER